MELYAIYSKSHESYLGGSNYRGYKLCPLPKARLFKKKKAAEAAIGYIKDSFRFRNQSFTIDGSLTIHTLTLEHKV